MSKRNTTLLLSATLLTIIYLWFGVITDILPILRGPDEWRWARGIPGTFSRIWVSCVILIAYCVIAFYSKKNALLAKVAAIIALPTITFALLYMDHPDIRSQLFYRTVSESSGGFYNVGVSANSSEAFLNTYVSQMPSFPVHPQRHPPGLPLLFIQAKEWFSQNPLAATRVSNELRPFQCHNTPLMSLDNSSIAAAIVQMIVPILLALMVLPLHFLTKKHYDKETANITILLLPLIPSMTLWSTRWNHLYAIFAISCLLLIFYALNKQNLLFFFLSGLIISIASFFSIGNFSLLGFVGCYGLIWLIIKRQAPFQRWIFLGGLLFLLGSSFVWLFVAWRYGLQFFGLMEQSLSLHYGLQRSYWFWLQYHLLDFFIFLGIPITVVWFYNIWIIIRDRSLNANFFFSAFTLGLLLLDISGTSQGEVARVWAFLMPLALATCAKSLKDNKLFGGIIILLAIQLFISNIFLRPVGTGLSNPPEPPDAYNHTIAAPIAEWESGASLLEYNYSISSPDDQQDAILIETVWSTFQQIDKPHTVFVHVLDGDGNLIGQADGQPLAGKWPTTCWQNGAAFVDTYTIPLPQNIDSSSIQITAGFYWLPTGERVKTENGQDAISLN